MREFRPIILLLLFVGGTFCLPPDAMYVMRQVALAATVYYVQTDGNNGNVGTSTGASNAWADPGYAASQIADGDILYIKSGVYTLSSASAGAGGPVVLPAGFIHIYGYESSPGDGCPSGYAAYPEINCGDITPASGKVVTLAGTSTTEKTQSISYVKVDANGKTTVGIYSANAGYNIANFCTVVDCVGYSYQVNANHCLAQDGTSYGFFNNACYGCVASNCDVSGFRSVYIINCIASGGSGYGFYVESSGTLVGCIAVGCGTTGFICTTRLSNAIGCVALSCGAYGFAGGPAKWQLVNCALPGPGASSIANTSGNYYTEPTVNIGPISLTTDASPFTSATDFRPLATGNGALLRAAGLSVYGQSDNRDIGAVQHADPAASGGETSHVWVR